MDERPASPLLQLAVSVGGTSIAFGSLMLVDKLGVPEGFPRFFAQSFLIVSGFLLVVRLGYWVKDRKR